MTLKHFLKHQNRSKNKIGKITVKSRNHAKSAWISWEGAGSLMAQQVSGQVWDQSQPCVASRRALPGIWPATASGRNPTVQLRSSGVSDEAVRGSRWLAPRVRADFPQELNSGLSQLYSPVDGAALISVQRRSAYSVPRPSERGGGGRRYSCVACLCVPVCTDACACASHPVRRSAGQWSGDISSGRCRRLWSARRTAGDDISEWAGIARDGAGLR